MGLPREQREDLAVRFTHHQPTEEQVAVFKDVRDDAHMLAEHIAHVTPVSRERSLAITKLEEAVMWANAAVARHGLEGD